MGRYRPRPRRALFSARGSHGGLADCHKPALPKVPRLDLGSCYRVPGKALTGSRAVQPSKALVDREPDGRAYETDVPNTVLR